MILHLNHPFMIFMWVRPSSGDTITSCLSGPPEAGDISTMFKAQIVILFIFNMSFKDVFTFISPLYGFYEGTPAKG